MGVGDEQVVDKVFVFYLGCGTAAATAFLGLIDVNRLCLGVAAVRQRNDDFLFRNQVFNAQVRMVLNNLGSPFVAERIANIVQLFLDDVEECIGVRKNIRKFFNFN